MAKVGRPKKAESEKRNKTVPVNMRRDFYDRVKSFSELTGYSMAEIFRAGAISFINEWHAARQQERNAEK